MAAVREWKVRGGWLVLITLTAPHGADDALSALLATNGKAWAKMTRSASWGGSRAGTKNPQLGIVQRFGLAGYVRTLEVTDGPNGWHAHYHVLGFLRHRPSADEVGMLQRRIHRLWARAVVAKGGGEVHPDYGVDVRLVDDEGEVAARYLAKVEAVVSVGLEMARGDKKRGKRRGRCSPLDLAHWGANGDERASRRFAEYADAIYGQHLTTWSQGIRAELGLGDEQSDDEVVDELEEADTLTEEMIVTIPRDDWWVLRESPSVVEYAEDLMGAGRDDDARLFLAHVMPIICTCLGLQWGYRIVPSGPSPRKVLNRSSER